MRLVDVCQLGSISRRRQGGGIEEEDVRGDVLCPVSPRTMMAKSAWTTRSATMIMSSMLVTLVVYCRCGLVALFKVVDGCSEVLFKWDVEQMECRSVGV